MTGPACRDIRQALGIYVVGAIDPAERTVVDIHLGTCPDCREELAGLAGLPALLGRVPASEAERLILHSDDLDDPQPPAELLNSLLRRVADRRTSRRWSGILAAAAAVIIAVAGGAVGARVVAPDGQPRPAPTVQAAEVVNATNPQTNVSAIVSYSGRSWAPRWTCGSPGSRAERPASSGSWTPTGGNGRSAAGRSARVRSTSRQRCSPPRRCAASRLFRTGMCSLRCPLADTGNVPAGAGAL